MKFAVCGEKRANYTLNDACEENDKKGFRKVWLADTMEGRQRDRHTRKHKETIIQTDRRIDIDRGRQTDIRR